ncbi:P-loop NTPase fold protein [Pseudanabaena sp. PCC 6802]|uniref:P-loop NTPase fold protein n=1 Tax=Pseudanabaena sp. PCC 6802 TaxID=118173 RepID=UPI00034CB7FE|nr:P-loop NTPase fold protein [Pseudanabaena sp. PCC 6802]
MEEVLTEKSVIKELQEGLLTLGYDPGVIDGILGARTRNALIELQKASGVQVDESSNDLARPEIRELQRQLRKLGYDPVYIDGIFGPKTREALIKFQEAVGIEAKGILDANTLANLQEELSNSSDSRTRLKKQGSTQIYTLQTDKPWELRFDALVIPVGNSGGLGSFGQSMSKAINGSYLAGIIEEEIKKQSQTHIEPSKPILVQIPASLNSQLSKLQSFETTARSLICATVEEKGRKQHVSVANAAKAVAATISLAADRGISRLVIPLLGTGVNQLNKDKVAEETLDTIIRELDANSSKTGGIKEITIVDRENIIETLRVAANRFRQEYLGQSPNNDLPEGEDLLQIKNEVYALAEVLLMRTLEPPLAVGILGSWGSGKSYIMHLMRQKMTQIRSNSITTKEAWGESDCEDRYSSQKQTSPYVGHVYQITFDAWTYARSNLWASLMETIFFELNRQLTLEKQLGAVGIDPLRGGEIWKVLSDGLTDEERQTLIKNVLESEKLQEWEKIASDRSLSDQLWTTLEETRKRENETLKEKEEALKREQEKLIKRQNSLEIEIAFQVQSDPVVSILESNLKMLMGESFNQFQDEIKRLTGGEINHEDLLWAKSKITTLTLSKILTPGSLWKWANLNWKGLFLFTVFVLLSISFPLLLGVQNNIISSLLTAMPALLPATAIAKNLLNTWHKWHESIEKYLDDYENQVLEAREKRIREDPDLKLIEGKIKQLETQVEEQRQRVITANRGSLADFVNTKVESGLYGKKLGLMQQVKSDLASLAEQLTLPNKDRVPAARFNQKTEFLSKLFPRGPARVVLYIDDLDRCPPQRVVEVLEAIQLLVKLPLFVVVLAIDERYIARALEKVYQGVLSRKGNPSGIDYIEKIIQIPYRVRPVMRNVLQGYLKFLMQISEDASHDSNDIFKEDKDPSDHKTTAEVTDPRLPSLPVLPPDDIKPLPRKVLEFTKEEFDTVKQCCQQVELSPRTIKRLINVYKLFKIILFRSSQLQSLQEDKDARTVIVSFLVLSGRYPSLMRGIFDNLELALEEDQSQNKALIEYFPEERGFNGDTYLSREWRRLRHDAKIMGFGELRFQKLNVEIFNLVRSFCFIGDIGYDPDDFAQNKIPNH